MRTLFVVVIVLVFVCGVAALKEGPPGGGVFSFQDTSERGYHFRGALKEGPPSDGSFTKQTYPTKKSFPQVTRLPNGGISEDVDNAGNIIRTTVPGDAGPNSEVGVSDERAIQAIESSNW